MHCQWFNIKINLHKPAPPPNIEKGLGGAWGRPLPPALALAPLVVDDYKRTAHHYRIHSILVYY